MHWEDIAHRRLEAAALQYEGVRARRATLIALADEACRCARRSAEKRRYCWLAETSSA